MRYDINILNDYVERGLLEKNEHPKLPIAIYNYSRECQFSSQWDEITLNMRGTVLDMEGNVVARTFPKFFNLEEHQPEEIPNEPFDVFEKMDGSLGILFNYENQWIFATKGSFSSDQSIKGREFLEKYDYQSLVKDCTYLFEIIYIENRIVVSYDFEDIVLLAIIDNKDGYEYDIHSEEAHMMGLKLSDIIELKGFRIVKKYHGVQDYRELKKIIENNAEGFVIRFKSGFRIKIKGEEYVRLRRLLTNFSNVDIWETLKEEKDINTLLERVPDEFDKWVKSTISNLQYHKYAIEERAGKIHDYFRYGKYNDRDPQPTKKEFADHLAKCNVEPAIRAICFSIWDGKDHSKHVWKLLRPKYQKPFWNREEVPADSKWIKKD